MNDSEIIKALECCTVHKYCDNCPFLRKKECRYLLDFALDLINRQKAEIERLNGCVKSEEEVRAIMKSQMKPMVNEIINEQFDVAVKLARAEAIKEFAERLKAKEAIHFCKCGEAFVYTDLFNSEIDDLVKESVGEE